MDYIVINGKSSRQIRGLLIQSLPPVTKPLMRTEVEEIDGRDGDFITTLGYSAYDKSITIGLRSDYNIDDVISFFDSEGRIIFSNEPDKYYNFAIYDEIDFAKLIRYKTANVTMHIQPFKYSADETAIEKTFEGVTKEIEIRNNGNIYSKPIIEIEGTGNITIDLNANRVLSCDITDKIIIDVPNLNALDGDGNYLNRQVVGDYNDLCLKQGLNYISMQGEVTKIKIDHYSRWI